jgi:hypothetical protein
MHGWPITAVLALGLGYPWLTHAPGEPIAARVPPPAAARRVAVADGSFGAWLRQLPLLPPSERVHLYDGREKPRQDVHQAVVDLDVGRRDLQQCADAVMRLRAEYLFAAGRFGDIRFHPQPGKPAVIAWSDGPRRDRWASFLVRLFAAAGSASLAAELRPVHGPPQPGDVLIQGGYPGHAVLVLDAADTADGHRYLLLGQSYMPAQQFHVLKNLGNAHLSPWYDARALATGGIATPEWWRPFTAGDLKRFGD